MMVVVHGTFQEQIKHFLEGRNAQRSKYIARDDGHDEEYYLDYFRPRLISPLVVWALVCEDSSEL